MRYILHMHLLSVYLSFLMNSHKFATLFINMYVIPAPVMMKTCSLSRMRQI